MASPNQASLPTNSSNHVSMSLDTTNST
ncbi:hypothetical protein ACHAW6_004924 [Cyclotella cf. meneghiniana]